MDLKHHEGLEKMNTRKQLNILKSLAIEKFTDNDVRAQLQKFFGSWDQIWDMGLTQHREHYEDEGLDAALVEEIYNDFESLSEKVEQLRGSL